LTSPTSRTCRRSFSRPARTTRPPAQAGAQRRTSMGTVFITTSIVLFATSVLTRSEWLIAATNVVIGIQIECAGPPAGVINITIGLLLLVHWNRRQRRGRGQPTAGAKCAETVTECYPLSSSTRHPARGLPRSVTVSLVAERNIRSEGCRQPGVADPLTPITALSVILATRCRSAVSTMASLYPLNVCPGRLLEYVAAGGWTLALSMAGRRPPVDCCQVTTRAWLLRTWSLL
jgi:hypothetical protein